MDELGAEESEHPAMNVTRSNVTRYEGRRRDGITSSGDNMWRK